MSKLYFIYAPMNSGKSLQLLATAYGFSEKGISFMILKPCKDTRDGTMKVKSRAGLEMDCVSVASDTNLKESIGKYNDYLKSSNERPLAWVFIDECQFLTRKQVDELGEVVDDMDINVMCYGLRTDFKSNLFEGSKRLFEIADDIREIKTICECGRKAIINARIDENNCIVTEGKQIMIGGNESYKTICRKDWNKNLKKRKENG